MRIRLPRPRARVRSGLLVALTAAGLAGAPVRASHTPPPASVTVAGSLQSELGCSGDWQPECVSTRLAFDASDEAWQGTFAVPVGTWEYKAALNDGWGENYGVNAAPGGANVPLNLSSAETVKFYYSHETHWITSNANSVIATVPGSFQGELGCPGDWQPDCLRSWLQDPDGDGTYTFSTRDLPAGNYEAKVAIDESWDENYGAGGVQNGPNLPFTVSAARDVVTFSYDAVSHVLAIASSGTPPQPSSVTIAGSLQSELGCPGDWQPDCAATHLAFDAADEVWQGTFNVPAGSWEYKAALNESWDENYGVNATRNGSNISLNLGGARSVKFYYDHATHWITDNASSVIATVPGSFQSELGCPGDWQPDCLRSWLQDTDGDGVYSFATRALPPGSYEAKVAIEERWDENYGASGVPNGPNIGFTVPAPATEIFFSYDATTHILTISAAGAPRGDLRRAQAHWLSHDTVAWNVDPPAGGLFTLHYAPDADLQLTGGGVQNGIEIPLSYDAAGLPDDLKALFPHLASHKAFKLPAGRLAEVPEALRGQLAVSAKDAQGQSLDATALQIPGVLDDLYTYAGQLGVEWSDGVPMLRVWAPTAKSVRLRLFADSNPASPASVVAMTRDDATGVWSVSGDASWKSKFYLYEVNVFVRATGAIETNLVTDPYSLSLSTNSQRSQIVDLADPALKPAGWDAVAKPPLEAPEDIAIYELHVRDFSAADLTVPEPLRGTFQAFTVGTSNGMRHLSRLARAGLTHVHLLPSFDFASVNEDQSQWQSAGDLSIYPPDSTAQQAAVGAVANADGYNWGYDPWHYDVPEGSYATDPDGPGRILEFREMVEALAGQGLRVVMDVVYNHTTASGQNATSVLDRIVPGYYHRLNADGAVETSTCCQNTATEHNMMERVMVDSVVLWAKHYKVDGFRFDLMGHHLKRNLLAVRQALDALTPSRDGVDGSRIYVYGEGWNFGEVANNARGVNATQLNMAGTGIGTFSDRLRDAARGGGPFSGLQEQGFLTGLLYDPNGTGQGSEASQRARLLLYQDWIKVGLAGNLAGYRLVDRFGNPVSGSQVDYNGQPAGYTADPQEAISYVEAHDNETLFDAIQLKAAPGADLAARVRMQGLGISVVGLSQGIPFFHAGVEQLRSKSLDRNSYNSGDWFNRLDFGYDTNNWGVGLPPAADNQSNWPAMAPLLANATLEPGRAQILEAAAHFREVLEIRRSSRLFRLRTAAEITRHLSLLNPGPEPLPGVVGLLLSDEGGSLDRRYRRIAVVFNANDADQSLREDSLVGEALRLHPVQAASADPVVKTSSFDRAAGTFAVPGRTAAVFVGSRPAARRIALLRDDVAALVSGGTLAPGLGHSLQAKLAAAQKQAARGNRTPAANQLEAFVNEVEALVRAGRLPEAEGRVLVAEASDIAAQLRAGL